MLLLIYAPVFLRNVSRLEKSLQDEVSEKLELFKDATSHKQLKVHKLRGRLKNYYSFSVNYKYRILFSYGGENEVNILAVGDHDIYQ